jgi:U3 small nucleolar RNA-associated protein 7
MRQWALRKSSTASVPELSFSQKGHLALTTGSGVNVYTPVNNWSSSPSHATSAPPLYLTHPFPSKEFSPLTKPTFSPFFDTMTVGHGRGFSTLLVPGSAEGKWDSMEADPFENVKMRREREVRGLLDRVSCSFPLQFPSLLLRLEIFRGFCLPDGLLICLLL